MRVFKQLLVGLPATGKSTFLAALWHVVDSGEVPGSLRLEKLHGEREHLNKIRNDWLSCREVARTVIGSEQLVSMQLTDQERGKITEVFFPDMSGESFRLQWKDRTWSKEYEQLVCEAGGILLFVHPKQIVEPVRIDIAAKIAAEVEMEKSQTSSGQDKPQDEPIPWDAESAPTQVQLVELLQFLAERAITPFPLRVAVIVSAWDLISHEQPSPEEWLTARLPLLTQFLKANLEVFERRVYGVSAQGGDLKDATGLLEGHISSQRIVIVGYNCNQNDLTEPVKWLMS